MQFNPDCTESFRSALYRGYELKEEEVRYAERLLKTVTEHTEEWEEKLDRLVTGYNVQGLYAADRCILYIALAEISYFEDVPGVVAVNEAVGLAKKFSTEKSPDFVNGVLASLIN